jgi:hypothetical protein
MGAAAGVGRRVPDHQHGNRDGQDGPPRHETRRLELLRGDREGRRAVRKPEMPHLESGI